jgi:tRNA(fMet)-specific endonuclease VapC
MKPISRRIHENCPRYQSLYRHRRGDADALQIVGAAIEVCLPLIVVAELRAGFRQGTRESANEAALKSFLAQPGVRVLLPDEQTTFFYASIEADSRKKGRAIPTNDVWIAALALQHTLTLYSRDSHFDNIPAIPRV